MDTQTQIDRLIELAIVQRTELKQLVEQLPQLREHLNAEIEKVFDEVEPQLRAELEDWTTKQTTDQTAKLGASLEAKITELAKALEVSTQARYSAILAEREKNFAIAAEAEAKIAEHAASLPEAVKGIVDAELARFPRAGEIDQLRKEFAEPRAFNPRGKWQAGVAYNKLDLVTINGDSYTSATDNNRTRPTRSSADWTLVAARGTGGGGGPTSLSELTTVPSNGDLLIGSGTSWVTSNLTAGAGISITVGAGEITISATDGDITLDDGTAASPSLHFTNDPDTGIYRPAANTLGISVSGTQVAYFDENGLTIPSAGIVAGGSFHAANGNANNPSHSFTSDQDTGFYRHATNQIGVSTSGTASLIFTENAGELLGHTGVSVTFGAGSSGATIALGQGTNGAVTITPKGSGGTTLATGLLVNSTTDSSSKDTGAIVTEGGLGVEKSATIGGNLTVSGTGTSTFAGAVGIQTAAATYGGGVGQFYIRDGTTPAKRIFMGYDTVLDGGYIVTEQTGVANKTLFVQPGGGATTIGGNLTVSGGTITGGASGMSLASGGTNQNITLTPSGTGGVTLQGGSSNGDVLLKLRGTSANPNGTIRWTTSTDTYTVGIGSRFNVADNGLEFLIGSNTTGMNLRSNGRLLLGTGGVDSGALLQVGTDTTTSAGGIGFGTDTSLYRTAAGSLAINGGVVDPVFRFYNGATQYGYLQMANSYTDLNAQGGTLYLKTSNSIALTLDSSQNATFAGKITANGAGSTFKGTSTNDNAAAGYVGEIITSTVESGSAVSLTSAALANITSISLTAGDWDVSGVVGYSLSGATVQSFLNAMNNASAALGPTGSFTKNLVSLTTITDSALLPTPVYRFTLTSTSTVYLIGRANFTAGTVSGYGHIRARRVR